MNRMALGSIMAAGMFVLGMGHSFGNPTGGQVASGSATINTIPGTVTINQASNIAIINWQTFSIASGELTKFVQPCSSSAALNRVLGGQTSDIDGTLSANGQVYLINGNGIVVGPGGVVCANSFIASTRDIADNDFLCGNLHFTGNSSSGVQNMGTINALGGDVYLIGKTVDNEGTIKAPNGTAGLASGDDVLLNLCGQEHVFVSPSPTATSASTQTAVQNGGAICAASAELKAANGNLFALAINNAGTIRATAVCQKGGRVFLTTDAGLIQNTGTIKAKSGNNGGNIKITGGSVWNRKTIDASGAQGGIVTVNSQNIQNDGTISVAGTQCAGGCVSLTYSGNALGSIQGLIDASGKTQGGTIQFLGTGPTSEAYLSLTLNVNSSCGAAGSIDIDTSTLYLTGATLTANGATQGGRIFLGEGDPESDPTLPVAQTVYISIGTSIAADATGSGNGGQIGILSDGTLGYFGHAEVKGAGSHGNAGTITIFGPALVISQPSTGGGTGGGSGGSSGGGDESDTASADPAFEFVDPDPSPGDAFGRPFTGLFNLSTNTTLITSPGDTLGGAGAGAVYLFSDSNGALLSTIRGSHAGDGVGATVQLFLGGNFAVESPNWNGNIGAVTFGNGVTGFTAGGGAISSSNSLIGSVSGDHIGSGGLTELFNGDYLVLSPDWNGHAGAVTWVDPALGLVGVVGAGNSLVGASPGDEIGSGGIFQLSNGANYLVLSPLWGGGMGAITNGSDGTAIMGPVSSSNSLVGAATTDGVGSGGSILDTGLGYYLVRTANWGGGAGAVTWNSDSIGTTNVVSDLNSLVGSAPGDHIGSGGISILYNDHNYVVDSPDWNSLTGAVTLGNGSHLITGVVGASNSLIGAAPGDEAGSGGITVLSDSENYVVSSPDWNGHAGAVTLLGDLNTVFGAISDSNSLVGASANDAIGSGGITVLDNGNILVLSPAFGGGEGAVTWDDVSPGHGQAGMVGSGNSLVGMASGDHIGSGGIFQLSNGDNYLVLSPLWGGGKGAITNGNAGSMITGVVSPTTSLVGTLTTDGVGASGSITDTFSTYYLVTTSNWGNGAGAVTWSLDSGGAGSTGAISASNSLIGAAGDHIGSGGITLLYNGNYAVDSPDWNSLTGAVTLGAASGGVKGPVTGSNSLIGANPGDEVGSGGIVQLSNAANYLVLSPLWGNGKGAVTNESDSSADATFSAVSATNSLVGASTTDGVGASGSITDSFDGYYLVTTSNFGGGAGAVTWNSDSSGATGPVSGLNSLIGTSSGDHIGSGGITILFNGNYVVDSPDWSGDTGAVTWGSASGGVKNPVSGSNSLIGATGGDEIGSGGIRTLSDGDYLVLSPLFDGSAGAVTWVDGGAGVIGPVTSSNSLIGAAGDHIGSGGIVDLSNGDYLVLSPEFDGSTGAVTWGRESGGAVGLVSASNSLVGASSNDAIGSGGIVQLSNGANYLVLSPAWGGGKGAVTDESDSSAALGTVTASNSLVGAATTDAVGTSGTIFDPNNGYYLVLTPNWGGGAGVVTWNSDSSGTTNVVSASNSLVGSSGGDSIGSGGITVLTNGNYLVLSPLFGGNAGAVTFASGTAGITGVVSATSSLVGANGGDEIGSGGIIHLDDGNYLVLSPGFAGGAGAVTWGSEATGIAGTVSATNSLVGVDGSDHIGSGGIVDLSNGDYLVLSPLFDGSAGAATWGSEATGVVGQVGAANSITGGVPDAGEQYAGQSADGSIYIIAFTTDTSAGGDGRVFAGSVDGPSSSVATPPVEDFFVDPLVISVEASEFNFVSPNSQFYVSDPEALPLEPVSVDALSGGALNDGKGGNLAWGSSTSGAPGPKRLVMPGNGIWNIFGGVVHSAPPPAFVNQQLQFNLSPAVLAHLHEILFGNP